jgi:polysaccharide deacetylase 2 family uncharacterized protein YibQ
MTAIKPKPKAGILGLHPLLAAVAAIVLVCAGAVFGAWLNVSSRDVSSPAPVQKVAAKPAKPRTAPPSFTPPMVATIEALPPAAVDEEPDDTPSVVAAAPPATVMPRPPVPMQAYAVPFDAPRNKPLVAIVIDDMGLDRMRSQRALEMQGPLTLSFLTYAVNLSTWALRAREAGHEVLAHLPMEPLDASENPGPRALLTSLNDADVLARMNAALDPWTGYVGVNNHMGSKFTADAAKMEPVMREMKARGLLWLDSKTSGGSVGPSLARALGVPSVERDVFLDNIQAEDQVLMELTELERIARQRGTAVAIGHPHDVTLSVLHEWLTSLPEKGIALAPLTEIARRQAEKGQQRAEVR